MPTLPIVQVNVPSPGWQLQLQIAIQTKKQTRIKIVGPLASTIRAQVVPTICMPPPKPPAALPIPAAPAAAAVFLANQAVMLAWVTMAFAQYGYSSMFVSYDGKGAGSADNELRFLLA